MKNLKDEAVSGVHADLSSLVETRSIAKQIDLNRRKFQSRSIVDGSSPTRRRGRGMEFAEVRQYQAGDDIRNIDWRVTARTQETYTKLFQEEKERPVYIVLDQRSPMFFGSRTQFKSYLAAHISALYVWAAVGNNDNLGALIFGDKVERDLRPKRGRNAGLRVLSAISEVNLALAQGSDISRPSLSTMLADLRRIARPGSAVFIVSDFHDLNKDCERELSMLSRHCNIELLHIFDPIETELPKNVVLPAFNGESRFTINTYDKTLRADFVDEWQQLRERMQSMSNRSKASYHALSTAVTLERHVHGMLLNPSSREAQLNLPVEV